MNTTEALKIYDCLFSNGKEGVPLLTIAKETQISTSNLSKYLRQFSKHFVRVGTSSKYAINSFSSAKDKKECLLIEVEKLNKKKAMESVAIYIAIGSAIFISTIIAISNGI